MSFLRLNSVYLHLPVGGRSLLGLFRQNPVTQQGNRISETGKGRVCVALNDLTFEIQAGEKVGLIGANGAGKSSLLRLLAGIYAPTSGEFVSSGTVSTLFAAGIGMKDAYSGRENIYLSARTLGMSRAQIEEAHADIVEFADLGEFIDMPIRTYSAGMRMRLGFAISTALRSEILLIDEVFGAGDAKFRDRANERMSRLIDRTGILVMATHSNRTILDFCERVIWLEQGKVRFDGAAEAVLQAFESKKGAKRKQPAARSKAS